MTQLNFSVTSGVNFNEANPPCSEVAPDMFFSVETEDANGKVISSTYPFENEAKAVCVSCPMRVQCLSVAVRDNVMGIWGGTTDGERRTIKRQRIEPSEYRVKFKNVKKSRRF